MSSRSTFLVTLAAVALGCGGSVTSPNEGPTDSVASTDSTGTDGSGSDVTIVDSGVDSSTVVDSSGDTTTGGIKCGTATCDPATEDCCVGTTSKCVPKGTCAGGAPLSCSDSSSCKAGEVCCAGGTGGGFSAKCAPSSSCAGRILCATDAECTPPDKCLPALGGYKVCRPAGGFDASGFDTSGFDAPKFDSPPG